MSLAWVAAALVVLVVVAAPRALRALVKRRLGGYRQAFNQPDARAPLAPASPRSVLVIGGGLGGIAAAAGLAERGFRVTLAEEKPALGGKLGARTITTARGEELPVEHGFHAFFRNYYNLRAFLERSGVAAHLRPIDDYVILDHAGRGWRFAGVEPTPVLNLVALWRRGLFSLREILLGPPRDHMGVFLEYARERTFAALDDQSYAQFAAVAALPPRLRLVFNTFARAFFAEPDRMSMAELVKSFHFYYLSHDHGLVYDYLAGDTQRTFIAPVEAHLRAHGVELALGARVERLVPVAGGVEADGRRYDHVVIATTAVGARALAERSPALAAAAPRLCRQLASLRPSQRYAVLRLWLDRDVRRDVPVFVATERARALDAVALVHRVGEPCAGWAARTGGAVLELHCYAVPDDLPDADVAAVLVGEAARFFPEIAAAANKHHHLDIAADFTAFHVGMGRSRPGVTTELPELVLAGDWVATELPAMLMEAAFSSGLLAANAILAREGLREHPVYTVPLTGVLANRAPAAPRVAASLDATLDA
jgi:isorenieratene synthase